jgi:hypothetical protein
MAVGVPSSGFGSSAFFLFPFPFPLGLALLAEDCFPGLKPLVKPSSPSSSSWSTSARFLPLPWDPPRMRPPSEETLPMHYPSRKSYLGGQDVLLLQLRQEQTLGGLAHAILLQWGQRNLSRSTRHPLPALLECRPYTVGLVWQLHETDLALPPLPSGEDGTALERWGAPIKDEHGPYLVEEQLPEGQKAACVQPHEAARWRDCDGPW